MALLQKYSGTSLALSLEVLIFLSKMSNLATRSRAFDPRILSKARCQLGLPVTALLAGSSTGVRGKQEIEGRR